jgi:hypothetical protein
VRIDRYAQAPKRFERDGLPAPPADRDGAGRDRLSLGKAAQQRNDQRHRLRMANESPKATIGHPQVSGVRNQQI